MILRSTWKWGLIGISFFFLFGCGSTRSETTMDWDPPVVSMSITGANGLRNLKVTIISRINDPESPEQLLINDIQVPFSLEEVGSDMLLISLVPLEVLAEDMPKGKVPHAEYGQLLNKEQFTVTLIMKGDKKVEFKKVGLTEAPVQP